MCVSHCLCVCLRVSLDREQCVREQKCIVEIETECTVIEWWQTESLDGNCDIGVWRVCELARSVAACESRAVCVRCVRLHVSLDHERCVREEECIVQIETECTVIERRQTESLDGNCGIGVLLGLCLRVDASGV